MLRMFHLYGLRVALQAIRIGSILVVVRKYAKEEYLAPIQKYKIPITHCAPQLLVLLAKDSIADKFDLSSLRTIWVATASTSKELHEEVVNKLPNLRYLINGMLPALKLLRIY